MKLKAVVCDDEAHARSIMRLVLRSMNIDVVAEAKSGDEAVDLYRREKPHLLLLDINMPGKTGDEALLEIIGEFPSALVIMLTSVASLESVEECLRKGAANYILKNLPVDDIKRIIRDTWEEYGKREQDTDNSKEG